jgi:hypothetical protein
MFMMFSIMMFGNVNNKYTHKLVMSKANNLVQLQKSYVPNSKLEHTVKRHLLYPDAGVHVLYLPKNEQSNPVRNAIRCLQRENKISGALELCPTYFVKDHHNSFCGWFNNQFQIQVPQMDVNKLFPILNRPVTLFFDEFETIKNSEWQRMLVGLAEDSVLTKKFNVLVVTSDKKMYDEMLKLNGGKKFMEISSTHK